MVKTVESCEVEGAVLDLVRRHVRQRVDHVERLVNPHAATFQSDLLRCALHDGTERWFLCKRGMANAGRARCGGLAYEAHVYERVLGPLGREDIPFIGAARSMSGNGRMTLVFEYRRRHQRVDQSTDMLGAMRLAARWLGEFHGWARRRTAGLNLPLVRHDTAYYWHWPRRLRRFLGSGSQHQWLAGLLDGYQRVVALLEPESTSVIHGDFYADNVLVEGEDVVVIDWSWAALGVGEIDLASLTARWPGAYVTACEQEYHAATRTGVPMQQWRSTLDAARVHLHCRWLAHRLTWMQDPGRQWRFTAIRQAGERLGVI